MKILIKESQYVYLLENLQKNKKFLTKVMGIDFTGKIEQITSIYDVPMEFDRYISHGMINRYLNKFGPMYLFELDGHRYLYLDVGDHEKFIDEKGNVFIENEIPERLGLDEIGLRFSNIIDMYFNEEETLNESTDKNKKFLTSHMGIDFTGKFKKITRAFDIPYNFFRKGGISLNEAMAYLNAFGPMYLFELGDYEYLYQNRGNKDWFVDGYGHTYVKDQFLERLGLDVLGLRFSDIVNMYFNEEESLNENVDKNKKFLTKLLGEDLIDSIQVITSSKELPIGFLKHFGTSTIQSYIDAYGPLYYFVLDGEKFVYKDRDDYEMYINDKGKSFLNGEITDRLGLSDMGLKFSNVIDTIFNEEDEDMITENKKTNPIDRVLKSHDITYDIKYGKRGFNNFKQYDSVIITFYVDRGNGPKPESIQPVYFFTEGNEIISEPIINGGFDWMFEVFEHIPEKLLNNYFFDRAKTYLENYLSERSN